MSFLFMCTSKYTFVVSSIFVYLDESLEAEWNRVLKEWSAFVHFIVVINYTFNPIIYLFVDSKFRYRMKLLYKQLYSKCLNCSN